LILAGDILRYYRINWPGRVAPTFTAPVTENKS